MPLDDVFYVVLDTKANITNLENWDLSMSGYDVSEVIGKNWFEIFIPESNMDEILHVFESFLKGNISFWEYENEITCKDGTHRLVKWHNTLLRDKDNHVNGVLSQGSLINKS